jgi:hypothetical protein
VSPPPSSCRFVSFRELFWEPLSKWADGHKDSLVRAHSLGTLAEVADAFDERFNTYLPDCFPVIHKIFAERKELSACTQTDLSICRNAAFLAGVLCMKGGDAAAPFVEKTLHALAPLLHIKITKWAEDPRRYATPSRVSVCCSLVPVSDNLPSFHSFPVSVCAAMISVRCAITLRRPWPK